MRSSDWWDVPGPSAFLKRLVQKIEKASGGAVALCLPDHPPAGLLDALTARMEQTSGVRVLSLRAQAAPRSPLQFLAAAAGLPIGDGGNLADFLDAPEVADTIFIVDASSGKDWTAWALFLRRLKDELARGDRANPPRLLLHVPASLPPSELRAHFGHSHTKWISVVTRADMDFYVQMLRPDATDELADRTAAAVVSGFAGYDPKMARVLAQLSLNEQLDPRNALRGELKQARRVTPSWFNGLVDRCDGVPFVHSVALFSNGLDIALSRRLWQAQVRVLFPMIEHVRQSYVGRYHRLLEAHIPFEKVYGSRIKTFDSPHQLEISDVFYLLRDDIPRSEADVLARYMNMRKSMAHMEPARPDQIIRASEAWEEVAHDFADHAYGWDWPRCGQKLTLLIGPVAGGKSTYAEQNYSAEEVISSDAIREEMFGGLDMGGDQSRVFEQVRTKALVRLTGGHNAVIDATNLRREHRMGHAKLVPEDFEVHYVVVDRPLEDKLATGGWHLEKPGLIERYATEFEQALEAILSGDALPNVQVRDARRASIG